MRTSCAVLLAVSCASMSCAEPNATRRANPVGAATLTGVITLNASAPENACDQLALLATDSTDNGKIGRVEVHASSKRCLYTVDSVPPGAAMSLRFQVPQAWHCQPKEAVVTLAPTETRTLDFRFECPGAATP
jgi:hypothetical protein